MIKILIKKFVPNYISVSDSSVRKSYGILCGILGIVCNLFLFALKLFVGLFVGSIAVTTDAFNNLSDFASSLVTVLGSHLSDKTADSEHPYGHGRAEYITALLISFTIVFFGIELIKDSVSSLFNPTELKLNIIAVALLVVALPVKLWMWHYNSYVGKKIDSTVLKAAAKDSVSDVFATLAVIISAILSKYIDFPIDAVAGICVSFLILKSGIGIAKETIDNLMGKAPEKALIDEIENLINDEELILGTHGLLIHDYGPGMKIASIHAEVPENCTLIQVHNIIDELEQKILRKLSVDIVIHPDPVPTESANTKR